MQMASNTGFDSATLDNLNFYKIEYFSLPASPIPLCHSLGLLLCKEHEAEKFTKQLILTVGW